MSTLVDQSTGSGTRLRVLIVDDDLGSLDVLEAMIEGAGVDIVRARSGLEAQEVLNQEGFDNFSCVFTDFRMPHFNGLDLLAWIEENDNTLATIILTAQGDKDLVTTSLRKGACDFVEKPFRLAEIRGALKKGVEYTAEQRKLELAADEVKDIMHIQERLSRGPGADNLGAVSSTYAPRLTTAFYPIHETGGDFINSYALPHDRLMVVVGDVSGHDLRAGFMSSYFQGIVRGMVRMKANAEQISTYFNGFLVAEWNDPKVLPRHEVSTSLAACFLVFDFNNRRMEILNNGFPHPQIYAAGMPLQKGGNDGPPLGWFEPLEARRVDHDLPNDGICLLWSDGLIDVAEAAEVSPFALAYLLLYDRENHQAKQILNQRRDDVLAVEVRWGQKRCEETGEHSACYFPIFSSCYLGSDTENIDDFQLTWQKTLSLCLPGISTERMQEALLCGREALLNAMMHGSNGGEDKQCEFLISYNRQHQLLRFRVDDEGEGYDISSDRLGQDNREHRSLGIRIMKSYADLFSTANRGASVVMEFALRKPPGEVEQ